jgi:hypothetical protein
MGVATDVDVTKCITATASDRTSDGDKLSSGSSDSTLCVDGFREGSSTTLLASDGGARAASTGKSDTDTLDADTSLCVTTAASAALLL